MKTKTKVFLSLLLVFAAITGFCLYNIFSIKNSFYEQNAHERWSSDTDYALVSAFWNPGAGISSDEVYGIRESFLTSLKGSDFENDARYDAFSAQTSLYVSSSRASQTLDCVVIGGDYFKIHSHRLVSGCYISDDVTYTDCCVLDENAAWQLFGAIDVAGMELTVGDSILIVSGVIKPYAGQIKQSSDKDPKIYVLYSSPCVRDSSPTVECYEAMLPNPIKDYASGIFKTAVSGADKTVVNSERFSFISLYKTLPTIISSAERSVAAVYPFWENAALKGVTEASVYLLGATVAAVFTAVWLIALLVFPVKYVKTKIHNIIKK